MYFLLTRRNAVVANRWDQLGVVVADTVEEAVAKLGLSMHPTHEQSKEKWLLWETQAADYSLEVLEEITDPVM